MLTVPDGSAEGFDNHVSWVACNLEHGPAQWLQVRQRAASLGIKVIPWIRLARTGETFEDIKARLSLLVATANTWRCDTILPNYEDEADRISPKDVARWLYGYLGWGGQTGWSMQAWLPNDPDFSPLSADPVLLQIFPADLKWDPSQIEEKMGDCVEHARAKGFTYVGVTYQTYAGAQPEWFDCASCMHSTYPGNLIQSGEWGKWYE